MAGSRPEEPEVIDLGLLEPVDASEAPVTERDDEQRAEERPRARGLTERWRRARASSAAAWRSPTRAALVVAAVVGLLVGAVAYGAADRQQELASARANPLLVAQVVPNSDSGYSGAFNVFVSVANASDRGVTVRGIALVSDPERFSRDGLDREVGPQSQATLLLGAELRCDEPTPALDRLRLDITTADEVRRTVEVPLLRTEGADDALAEQREWFCRSDSLGPAVYASTMISEDTDDPTEVRIRFDLQYQGEDAATLTGLVPVTDAFSVVAEEVPRALGPGIDEITVLTVWRVANCARAGLTGGFDVTLAPEVDGVQQQELVRVFDEPFADLVRLGARVCTGS